MKLNGINIFIILVVYAILYYFGNVAQEKREDAKNIKLNNTLHKQIELLHNREMTIEKLKDEKKRAGYIFALGRHIKGLKIYYSMALIEKPDFILDPKLEKDIKKYFGKIPTTDEEITDNYGYCPSMEKYK